MQPVPESRNRSTGPHRGDTRRDLVTVGHRVDGLARHLQALGLRAEAAVARSVRDDLAAIHEARYVVRLDERARWLP